jgi:hypothetical protein
MNTQYLRHIANTVSISLLVFILLLGLQVVLMMTWAGGVPNRISLPPVQHADFYLSLWSNRPHQALILLLVDKPLFLIECRLLENGIDVQAWAVSLFAGNFLLYVLVSIYVAVVIQRLHMHTWQQWRWRVAGLLLVILAMVTVRRADCCIGGPGWIGDVWLLSYLVHTRTMPDWQSWYVDIKSRFIYVQSFLVFCGLLMLYISHRQAGK